ncbi:uncharacterized protein FA14DRAFT_62726 [Meira miltonrushii]|uniref:Uncharacterized protein n=1 Tax=Meira miltonrushii TaxID=1280837 RepID=A0A316VDC4_9BASI|nr:uncharacterized protein FA14DRAFT_62726 [Meira miltonrushii]PWN33485.1 hypothetical protein FA14DRAFT_62726 [Meira miltonrushii]
MPAIRTSRPDIIIRVPRAINLPKQSKETEDGSGEGKEDQQSADHTTQIASPYNPEASGSTPSRRSASPVKGGRSEDHLRVGPSTGEAKEQSSIPPSRYQYASQATSSAEWNSLLIWARRQRGPQWDSATGMWQVDQGSTEYYAFSNDPARHTKLSYNLHQHHEADQETQDGNLTQDGMEQDSKASMPEVGSIQGTMDGHHHPGHHDFHNNTPFNLSSSAGGAGGSIPIGYNEDSPPPMGPGGRRARAR